ncbi:hypothetical protein M8I34_32370 [Streptomyces sp. MCA2]|uniref:hypothetical protein n=1 Tax=Streptomyces sp. MCA2 TaxID=2944805 RepID=UPI0020226041|nr:hypothetical protein [Streptomyces sp. MCA2]MCL7496065.1 hypothetical protein [Streptomyces sp. MCA2]
MLTLFSRTTAQAELETTPEPWPETWAPEGVIVAQRYLGLAGAVVLVYTTASSWSGQYYAVACLGCTYVTARHKDRPGSDFLTQQRAAELANTHAGTCRALPRPLPDRPDDETARDIIRRHLHNARRSADDIPLLLTDFHPQRLVLQRTTSWIETELLAAADEHPDVLTAKPHTYGPGHTFTLHPFPRS